MKTKNTKQEEKTRSKSIILDITKKRDDRKISEEQLEILEQLFFMGGITSYQASKQCNIDPKTAKSYFEEWAEKLTDDPQHESWITKEKKIRARVLESITKQIIPVKENLQHFEKLLAALLYHKKDGILVPNTSVDLDSVERIEKIVRANRIYFTELQQQYSAIEMTPPVESILEIELEKYIAQKQEIIANTVE